MAPVSLTTVLLVVCSLQAARQSLLANAATLAVANAPLGEDHAPTWAVKDAPKGSKKFCGFELAKNVATTTVYRATERIGAYNHAAMMGWAASSSALFVCLVLDTSEAADSEPLPRQGDP